jgi:O-acetyl-ADP-ribose deacetylase (regulator of RNase III)
MAIIYKNGDLFTSKADGYAHGCNAIGVMGAGIAVQFKKRFPDMFEEYRIRCLNKSLGLGSVFQWCANDGKMIYNLITQARPGPCAKLEDVDVALLTMARIIGYNSMKLKGGFLKPVTIAMPRIACGHGGLNWKDVEPLFIKYFEKSANIDIEIYTS